MGRPTAYSKVMTQIAIYGAGGFGREAAWLAESCALEGDRVEVACFIDDDPALRGVSLNGIPVYGLEEARERFPEALVIGGTGNPQIRQRLMERARDAGFGFGRLVHSETKASRWVTYGEGVVICAGNILTTNIHIGDHVQINPGCTIGHDVVLGDYATLTPGAHIAGFVHLGKRVFVGTGAVIINGTPEAPLTIGDDAVIGAAACVIRSVGAGETVAGVPAKIV